MLGTGPSEFPLAAVTKLGADDDRNVSSHRSGSQEFAVRWGQGRAPSEGSRAGSYQPLHLLVAASGPWLVTTSLQFLPPSSHDLSSVSVSQISLCPSLIRTSVTGFRVHPDIPGSS